MPAFGVTPVGTYPPPVADDFPGRCGIDWRTSTVDITLVNSDASNGVECNQTGGTQHVIIPADVGDTSIDFDSGDWVAIYGAGTAKVTVTPAAGVTLRYRGSFGASIAGQYGVGVLLKRDTNLWIWFGDISA